LRINLKRLALLGAATIGVTAAVAIPVATPASAVQLPAGATSSGPVTLSPASGNSSTSIQLIPPTGADCPGSGADNFRYHTYITPLANDPSQLDYNAQGTPAPLPTANLRTAAGSQLRALSPAIGNNFLSQQTVSFASGAFGAASLPPGQYWVGFACTSPDGQLAGSPATPGGPTDGFLDIEEFWATAITITASAGAGPNSFTYATGVVNPPTINSVSPTAVGTVSVAFTPGTSDPAATFNVAATPTGAGVTPAPVTGAAGSPVTLTGLTVGAEYSFVVTAVNSAGTAASAPFLYTVGAVAGAPVTGLTVVEDGTALNADISWTAPADLATYAPASFTGYLVEVLDGATVVASQTVPAASPVTNTPTSVTDLAFTAAAGTSYTYRVTPVYTAPFSAPAATVSRAFPSASLIIQELTTVRPEGALVLTQRCGVYGDLPSFSGVGPGTLGNGVNFLGFPYTSPGVAEFPVDPDQDPTTFPPNGTSPDIAIGPRPGAPFDLGPTQARNRYSDLGPTNGTVQVDDDFSEYPYPINGDWTNGGGGELFDADLNLVNGAGTSAAVYPTGCEVDLGTARLVTGGPLAGEYFAAQGRMNQVSVVNTQDLDDGWDLTMFAEPFVNQANGGQNFEGNFLGFAPVETYESGAVDLGVDLNGNPRGTYDMVVDTQGRIYPGEGVGTPAVGDGAGLGDVRTIATSAATDSLGLYIVDGLFQLLFPVEYDSGTYLSNVELSAF
jgi:hypothetical protein